MTLKDFLPIHAKFYADHNIPSDVQAVMDKVMEEASELVEALATTGFSVDSARESADLSNVCFRIMALCREPNPLFLMALKLAETGIKYDAAKTDGGARG